MWWFSLRTEYVHTSRCASDFYVHKFTVCTHHVYVGRGVARARARVKADPGRDGMPRDDGDGDGRGGGIGSREQGIGNRK